MEVVILISLMDLKTLTNGSPMEMAINIGDLVRQDLFNANREGRAREVSRYGIVIGKTELNYPKDVVMDKMYKVLWSASPDFPVSGRPYTCFVTEKQVEVVS